ncbi:MAG: hydrogenase subunit MbhD domain-containing protein [Candidatus Bipolaricaulia bacterium]
MTAQLVLLVLLPVTAGFALVQRRRLNAIIGMAVFSMLLASVFFLSHAPDVAITEAAIGAALVTFIYVLAIRKTGRLTVAASEVPALLERAGERISGLEWEILDRLAKDAGLDLVIVFVPHEEVAAAVSRGEADIGAGGLVAADSDGRLLQTREHLQTARFVVSGPRTGARPEADASFRGYVSDVIDAVRAGAPVSVSLDLARFLALSRHSLDAYDVDRQEGTLSYTFLVSPSREDLHRRLQAILSRMKESGDLDSLIRRHFP